MQRLKHKKIKVTLICQNENFSSDGKSFAFLLLFFLQDFTCIKVQSTKYTIQLEQASECEFKSKLILGSIAKQSNSRDHGMTWHAEKLSNQISK